MQPFCNTVDSKWGQKFLKPAAEVNSNSYLMTLMVGGETEMISVMPIFQNKGFKNTEGGPEKF